VEDGPRGDGDPQHFLEAEGLGTKLHVVVVPAAPRPAFVLDRIGDEFVLHISQERTGAASRGRGAEFDQVCNADELEAVAAEPDVPGSPPNAAEFLVGRFGMNLAMGGGPFEGIAVLDPYLLTMVQDAPPLAEQ
jgi:hypothetical protein